MAIIPINMNTILNNRALRYLLLLCICTTRVSSQEFTCGQGFTVTSDKPATFSQPYSPDTHCKWEILKMQFNPPHFQGDKGVELELSCTVDLPSDPLDCAENSLLITDGVAGSQKYCGETELRVRASEKLRDLFAVFSTSGNRDDKAYKGIECTAKVVDAADDGRLAKNFEGKTEQRCVCGTQSKGDRIVGGEDADFNEFPWLAAIVDKGTRRPFCGGALINDRFILTAAHCFFFSGKKAEDMEVLLHAHVLDMTVLQGWKDVELGIAGSVRGPGYDLDKVTDADEKTLRFEVEELISHPLFTPKYDYDFALLKLDRKIDLGDADSPTPVCLPPADTYDTFSLDEKNLTVAGWGLAHEKAKASTRLLQKLVVPFMTRKVCGGFLAKHLTNRMICSGFEEGIKDACTGDSGGPLIHNYLLISGGRWELSLGGLAVLEQGDLESTPRGTPMD
ncbi:Transmembrane protease serine 9 [Orchesella cincta]|uniref:Transmembrane protease serine 9 n=1 Tax=Orchesella cincta TaxID=48709 RepID=A0A1D2MEX9_ORCCI|nr:Transmembrane protease serine 9 [Orchesella cincta]